MNKEFDQLDLSLWIRRGLVRKEQRLTPKNKGKLFSSTEREIGGLNRIGEGKEEELQGLQAHSLPLAGSKAREGAVGRICRMKSTLSQAEGKFG